MTSTHSEAWLKNRHFGLVIDAGSSGSRIHIYSWIDRAHLQQTTSPSDLRGTLPTIEPGVESGALNSADWTKRADPGMHHSVHMCLLVDLISRATKPLPTSLCHLR